MNSVVCSAAGAVEVDQLVEAAVDVAFAARPVVADDVVDERVLQDAQVLEGVDEPADVVVGVLQEPRVDLHLAREHGLEVVGDVVPRRDLVRPLGQLCLGRDHAQLLLAGERLLAQRVPALVEAALVLRRPLRRNVVRRMRGTRREVGEERLVGHQRLLLTDPLDRPIGQILGEVVALLRGLVGLNRRGSLIQRRRVLVGLAADEPIEVLEAAATRWPGVKRPERAGLPHGHLVALAELRGRVPVELQRLGQRRARVRAHRVVAGRRRGDLGDAAHPHRVVVAARQQRRARRRAERGGVKAGELQALIGEALGRRRVARAAEGARAAEAGIVDQHDQHVRRTRRRPQRRDRREGRGGILRVLVHRAVVGPVGDRQNMAIGHLGHGRSRGSGRLRASPPRG